MSIGRKFGFKIVNGSGSDKVVAFTHATFKTLGIDLTEGAPNTAVLHYHDATQIAKQYNDVDLALDDGTIDTSIVVSPHTSKHTVRHFIEHIKRTPAVCKQITISADDTEVFSQQLKIADVTPLTNKGETTVDLSRYYGTMQFNSNKIDIKDLEILMDQNALIYMNVPAGRTVNVTYYFD